MTKAIEFQRAQVLEVLGYEGVDFWGEEYAERFHHALPLDCVLEYLDNSVLTHVGQADEYLRKEPLWLTIVAYRRGVVSESNKESWAEAVLEGLREGFSEEYGDYDDGDDGLSDADVAELRSRATGLVEWYLTKAKVFPSEQLRKFTLDSEDLIEIIQQLRPQWLKGKP